MPTLSLTLTVPQVARAAAALRHLNNDVPATQVQIEAWLLRQLRATVLRAEDAAEGATAGAKARATLAAEGW